MTPPSDEPTRPVGQPRPRQPIAPSPGAPPPGAPPARTWEDELADRISSLRNWVIVVALVSVAALAVGLYALSEASNDDATSSSKGASSTQLKNLRERVSDLEDSTPSDSAISKINDDVDALGERVTKVEDGADSEVSAADLEALKTQIGDLQQQVDDLEVNSGQ